MENAVNDVMYVVWAIDADGWSIVFRSPKRWECDHQASRWPKGMAEVEAEPACAERAEARKQEVMAHEHYCACGTVWACGRVCALPAKMACPSCRRSDKR